MIFELFNELLNHALTEFRIHAFKVSLHLPDWNFIPSPITQFSIVAGSTWGSEEIRTHHCGRFLAKRDLTLSDHCSHPEEHCVDVFHSSEPSSAPNRHSSCGVHPHMGFEFPSPVPEKTLQAKHFRCCTHQAIILRFAGAERNHGQSLAVRANSTVTQHQCAPRNTLPG